MPPAPCYPSGAISGLDGRTPAAYPCSAAMPRFTMQPKDVVRSWIEAFNRADSAALAAMYEENATNHQVALQPVTGRAAIRRMFEEGFAAAEMHCIPENLFQDGDWAILEWRDPKGLRGCGFFHIRNGKIAFQRGYWDRLSFANTHGMKLN